MKQQRQRRGVLEITKSMSALIKQPAFPRTSRRSFSFGRFKTIDLVGLLQPLVDEYTASKEVDQSLKFYHSLRPSEHVLGQRFANKPRRNLLGVRNAPSGGTIHLRLFASRVGHHSSRDDGIGISRCFTALHIF